MTDLTLEVIKIGDLAAPELGLTMDVEKVGRNGFDGAVASVNVPGTLYWMVTATDGVPPTTAEDIITKVGDGERRRL
jgi:hypothetical protein